MISWALAPAFVALLGLTTAAPASDYFPAQKGNYWHYLYTKKTRLIDTAIFDTGTISWQILKVSPMQRDTIRLFIRQCKTLALCYKDGVKKNHAYYDTLILNEKKGENRLWFAGDAWWSFIHDPDAAQPPNLTSIKKITVTIKAGSINAVQIAPVVIHEKGAVPISALEKKSKTTYVILGENTGMVRYIREYEPQAPGEKFFTETWELDSINLR